MYSPFTSLVEHTSEMCVSPTRTPFPFKSRRPRLTLYFVYNSEGMMDDAEHLFASSIISGVIS